MNQNVPKKVIDKWFGQFNSIDIPKQRDFNDRLEKEYEELDFSDNQLNRLITMIWNGKRLCYRKV